MIYPTTESEKQEFYAVVLPGFLEYLRSHMSAIEQVELATVKNGIVSFPATQIIGGVQKTVRVPLSLVTADIDAAETEVREMAAYAKQQGDYAKQQAAAVNAAGDYANEQGRYAKAKGDEALAAKNTVTSWFNPFRDEVEDWAADAADAESKRVQAENIRKATWTDWESAEAERQRKELLRIAAENERIEAELSRIEAELKRARAELERKAAEDIRNTNEEIRLDGTWRQNTDTGNWEKLNQRTGEWEDSGNSWMGGLFAFKFYTNPKTGKGHVVKNSIDKVTFSIRNGKLVGIYNG